MALLNRHELNWSMSQAVRHLSSTGNLWRVLSGYLRLMKQRDVALGGSKMTEKHHRDSLWVTILDNPAIAAAVEYQVSKQSEDAGFVYLLIESKNLYTVVEFKNIERPFLNLRTSKTKQTTQDLTNMSLTDILHLQFHKRDKFQKGTIQKWVDGDVCDHLRSYVMGQTVQHHSIGKNFRAFAVVIIGSCQILVREMDHKGEWKSDWNLVKEPDSTYRCIE
jgi:hypothetical protein